jgi:hypothetical protein
MVTNYPHQIAPRDRTPVTAATPADDGLGTRVVSRMRQFFCGIQGHDSLLQFGEDRLFLKCVTCGHESPGWALSEDDSAHVEAKVPQQVRVRPQLAGARRMA